MTKTLRTLKPSEKKCVGCQTDRVACTPCAISTQQVCQHAHRECDGKGRSSGVVCGTIATVGSAAVGRSGVLLGVTERSHGIGEAGSCAFSVDALAKSSIPHVETIWIDRPTIPSRGGGFLLDAVIVAIDWADDFSISRRGAVAFQCLLGILFSRSSLSCRAKQWQEQKSEGEANDKTAHSSL